MIGGVNVLRPSAAEAEAAWRDLVIVEREQVETLPDRPRPEDFYAPVAQAFKADPRRTDEPLLDLLRGLVRPDETWIDIGAGGGRYTLPIALLTRRVYAVEPSAGMRAAIAEAAHDNAIENLDVFDERWPGPSTAPVADVAFISHVGYDIADIGPFLDEMEAHASRCCVAVLFNRAPISEFAALWAPVHGEERVLLPAMGEFMTLLFARGATPELRFLDLPPRVYEDLDSLQRSARRPVWVLEGSEKDRRLGEAVRDLAVEVDGGYVLNPRPRRLGVATWEPRRV
jgi:SAM-dependent methyltransferase